MKGKKKKRGNVRAIFQLDLEDGELLDFIWTEDYDPPPIIKPKIKRKDASKKES